MKLKRVKTEVPEFIAYYKQEKIKIERNPSFIKLKMVRYNATTHDNYFNWQNFMVVCEKSIIITL